MRLTEENAGLISFESERHIPRMAEIKIAKRPKKNSDFKIFTSTLSGSLMLGLYIAWASLFFF